MHLPREGKQAAIAVVPIVSSVLFDRTAPSDDERPRQPFGMLLAQADSISVATGNDNHSGAGSIILQPDDNVSLAATSRASSELDATDTANQK